jgi:TRAP-type uncharacterized transport system substrate-binding protein
MAAGHVAPTDAPEAEVGDMVAFVFSRVDFASTGNAEGVKVSKDSALRGITIPMHPGTTRFFASRP